VWRAGRVQNYSVQLLGRDDPAYQDWVTDLRTPTPAPDEEEPSPDVFPELPELQDVADWSAGVRALRESEKRAFDVRDGVYIAYVERGGAADRAGLPRNTVITHVNDQPVDGPDALLNVLRTESGSATLVRIQRRGGRSAFYEIL